MSADHEGDLVWKGKVRCGCCGVIYSQMHRNEDEHCPDCWMFPNYPLGSGGALSHRADPFLHVVDHTQART